jgi:D-alanyl-D-alanine carboxypeptidase/D-alanyl-D-alanine-endopeptidase (penicillin-binding protein 4)
VIIRGMGDPTISGRYFDNKVTKIPEDWGDSIAAKKIRIVRGRIIGDDNFFGDDVLGKHWEWDEESYWYSAQVGALSFNDNCVNWYVTPTKIGQPAKIQLQPSTEYVTIKNQTITVSSAAEAKEIEFTRERHSNVIRATGQIPITSETQVGYVTVENPTLFTATVFKEILQKRGIRVDSGAVDIDSLLSYTYHDSDSTVIKIATYQSPKLEEILKIVNKRSQNLFAELLLRTVAAVTDSEGTGDGGLDLEKKFLKQIGISPDKMYFMDGSGYSRTNLVTPESIAGILKFIRQHKYWKTFYESLPKAGIERTLNHRMKGTLAEGNVRAKTGTMDNVSAISGFVTTADGEEMVFSILCNNFNVDQLEVQKAQDSILVKLASFTRN